MVHAFLLLVYLGTGETRSLVSGDMYFYSIVDCNFYAAQVSKRYGNYRSIESINPKDRVTAYCVPKNVNPETVRIYDPSYKH